MAIVAVILLLVSPCMSQSVAPIAYNSPESCAVMDYYNIGNLSCSNCPVNFTRSNLGNPSLGCSCVIGHYKSLDQVSQPAACHQCPDQDSIVSNDGHFCLKCQLPLTYNEGACVGCNSTSVFVDILPNDQLSPGSRTCVPCPLGTVPDGTNKSCVPCGIPDCAQCSPLGELLCFNDITPPASSSFSFYNQHLNSWRRLCINRNTSACQIIVNLCVLSLYNKESEACVMAIQLAADQSVKDIIPQLFYPEFGADDYLSTTSIITQFDGKFSHLLIKAAQYSLNGSFIGLTDVMTDEILLCKDRPSKSSASWSVGIRYEIQCVLNSSKLSNEGSQPTFFDLFLLDNNQYLVPIPLLVVTASSANQDEGNIDQWQFVRRFLLYQSLTDTPMYMSSLQMNVQLAGNGHIQPPYFIVTYSPIAGSAVQSTFTVQYESIGNNLNIGLAVLSIVFAVIGLVYTGFKVNGYMRRNGATCCELKTLVFVIVQFCSILSTLWLLILFVSSLVFLILFKSQGILFITLPYIRQEISFIIMLALCFIFRFIQIIYLLWKQATVEIFLIDWEKSQNTSEASATPVSIWRTYFIANEWNEIQTHRKLNSLLILLLTVMMLEVAGFVNIAEHTPTIHFTTSPNRYSPPHSSILRFSLAVSFYAIFAVLLRLYMILIHERYIENKMQQFIDLCSMSNVSLFILSDALFGHYIHGRSVHGKSDTGMKEMNDYFIKEMEDRCSKRGLANTDDQTFQVAITTSFQNQYYKVKSPIDAMTANGWFTGFRINDGVTDVSLKTYQELTAFMTSFLEHNVAGCDYIIKNKLLIEKLFGMEFYDPTDRSYFYPSKISFVDVLFYGNEWNLISFELLLFLLIDLAAHNFVLAAIITYIAARIISFVREVTGRKNLGKKALIDNRFLI